MLQEAATEGRETGPSFFELPVNNDRDSIISNIQANAGRGLPQLKQLPWSDLPLMIVAGGPSLHDFLPMIRQFKPDCHVLAVNGAYKFLREQGIECEHFVLIDSREDNLTHVSAPGEDTNHCLASQVHPALFDALRNHRVTMFHLGTQTARDAIEGQFDYLSAPVGMASVHAVYVGAALGYRTHMLFGYDFSRKAQASYAFPQPLNDKDEHLDINLDGVTYRTTLALARTAEQFQAAIAPVVRACELNVQLYSDGLLPAIIRKASQPHTEESEQAKYEAIWKFDAYRRVSPGRDCLTEALEELRIPQGASVADFGCGTGRTVWALCDYGYDGIGVDIASNALEQPVPFVQCALWDAAKLPQVDYGLCTDVLEHIPPDKVMDTLHAIHGAVSQSCYLNIDTIPDAFGVNIGQRLHLTVEPAAWWQDRLQEIWPQVRLVREDERQAIFVCTN